MRLKLASSMLLQELAKVMFWLVIADLHAFPLFDLLCMIMELRQVVDTVCCIDLYTVAGAGQGHVLADGCWLHAAGAGGALGHEPEHQRGQQQRRQAAGQPLWMEQGHQP
jgi:hypothetical protein